MAQALPCDLCGEESAVLLQSNLGDGSSLSVGPACLLNYALGFAVGLTGEFTPEDAAPYADVMAQLCQQLAPSMLALAKSAAPRRPRRKSTEDSPPEDAQGDGELPAGVQEIDARSLETQLVSDRLSDGQD